MFVSRSVSRRTGYHPLYDRALSAVSWKRAALEHFCNTFLTRHIVGDSIR